MDGVKMIRQLMFLRQHAARKEESSQVFMKAEFLKPEEKTAAKDCKNGVAVAGATIRTQR